MTYQIQCGQTQQALHVRLPLGCNNGSSNGYFSLNLLILIHLYKPMSPLFLVCCIEKSFESFNNTKSLQVWQKNMTPVSILTHVEPATARVAKLGEL